MRVQFIFLIVAAMAISCRNLPADQAVWQESKAKLVDADKTTPEKYRVFTYEKEQDLSGAGNSQAESATLILPHPDGSMVSFMIWKSGTVSSTMLEKYPDLQTYQGIVPGNEAITVRIGFKDGRMNAMVNGTKNTWFLAPVRGKANTYITYYKEDLPAGIKSFWSDKVLN